MSSTAIRTRTRDTWTASKCTVKINSNEPNISPLQESFSMQYFLFKRIAYYTYFSMWQKPQATNRASCVGHSALLLLLTVNVLSYFFCLLPGVPQFGRLAGRRENTASVPDEIPGGRSDTGSRFSRSSSVFPCQHHSAIAPYPSITAPRGERQPWPNSTVSYRRY
jgi:hypothetical protein